MNSLTKKINKFIKSKFGKTFLVLVGVVILFSWFPSCSPPPDTIRTVSVEPHPTRDGHMTAPSKYNSYIKDISFKLDETTNPFEATVGLIYTEDGGKSGEVAELNLKGAFGANNDPLIAKIEDEQNLGKVNGLVNCLVPECSSVVTIHINYTDEKGNIHSIQGQSTNGRNVEFNEPEVAENTDGTREANVILGPIKPARIASDSFISHWKSYLNNLKENGKNIQPNFPPEAIEVNYTGEGGNFIKLSANAPTDTFARPINMRIAQGILVEDQDLDIPGILLNSEKLVNSEQHCVTWSKDKKEDGTLKISEDHRYASSLLNAVLLFVGQKLKRGEACAMNIVLGQASNQEGGELPLLSGNGYHNTHQNGLDVDIAYTTSQSRQGLFTSIVDAEGSIILEGASLKWQRSLMKYFYDTGMVNRFVTSPKLKAQLVKLSKDEGNLSIYQNTLVKIYPNPAPKYKDRLHLEIICAAGGMTANNGVTENVGCRDTSASSMEWSVDWCDDNTCQGSEPETDTNTDTNTDTSTHTV